MGINSFNSFAESGIDVAQALEQRYKSNIEICPSGATLYECSGIIARMVKVPDAHEYDVWDPSPSSIERNGVSFSFIREDISRRVIGGDGGFIFYPKESLPKNKISPVPLCYFPIDGVTSTREGNGGCGISPSFPATSAPCQEHGVLSAQDWISNSPNGGMQIQRQCGFDLHNYQISDVAKAFYEGILSGQLSDSILNNEMVIETWESDIPSKLPIEAFIYIDGTTDKSKIKFVQTDYYAHTGYWVPIIKVTEKVSGDAYHYSFSYEESDQGLLPRLD